jgi:hypothetical protein
MTALIDDLVPDELWALVEPLLPAPPRPPYGGRHRAIPDRNCFAAIVFREDVRLQAVGEVAVCCRRRMCRSAGPCGLRA